MLQAGWVLLLKAAGQPPLGAAMAPSLPCCRQGKYLLSCRQGSCSPLPSDMDFLWGPRRVVLLFQAKLCS